MKRNRNTDLYGLYGFYIGIISIPLCMLVIFASLHLLGDSTDIAKFIDWTSQHVVGIVIASIVMGFLAMIDGIRLAPPSYPRRRRSTFPGQTRPPRMDSEDYFAEPIDLPDA